MTLSRVKTWAIGETLTASDLNAEFDNILQNATSLVSGSALDNYTTALLPSNGTTGRLVYVTDGARGVWGDSGASWFPVGGGVYNVQEFGAIGNGTTNDTSAIQSTLDAAASGSTVIFPSGTYLSGNLTITNKTNLTILGLGGVLQWTGTAGAGSNIGIQLVGTCTNITISGLRMVGDSNTANGHAGIWMASGQTISNLKVLRNHISNVIVGISFNAALSGTISIGEIAGNVLDNIVGTDVGSGYGIHLANATQVQVHDNHINKAQRHAIYQAIGTNAGNEINNNTITNHRQGVSTDAYVAALVVSRTTGVNVHDNTIMDGYDTGLEISWDTQDAGNIQVDANKFINRKNTRPFILIGTQSVPSTYNVRQVLISNNIFSQEYVNGGADVELLNGRQIVYTNNSHRTTGITGTARFVSIGNGSYINASTDADLTAWTDNVFHAEGSSLVDVRGFELDADICGNTSTHELYRNRYESVSTEISLGAALSNTNVHAGTNSVVATGSLPSAAAIMDGTILIEDAGAGNRNLIVYAGGQRFRIDGGAAI